jgi:putative DNA primase/helicase
MFTILDDLLDRDKLLLNVENGTIDLRTGELGPHDPTDLITKIAPVAFDPEATCPAFKRVVDWITNGDREFINYLRRAFGYCLTGCTTEQSFFFVIGKGGTGKSVLANVLRELLGEYGLQANMDSFLAKQYDNGIPTDIARLRGARVVVAAEANFDRQIDEAKLKTMTGGDPLVARFMRQDLFEFMPEFKLVLIANDFPRVRASSDAFWRRVRVIPIDRKIPAKQVDPNLMEKLRAEYPGILAWAVRGCLSWQQRGLPMRVSSRREPSAGAGSLTLSSAL